MRKFFTILALLLASLMIFNCSKKEEKVVEKPIANKIVIQLNHDKAPKTVDNFLSYCKDGFYEGTIFHRVIPGFMIQAGGLTADMNKKGTKDPVVNEANNGLKNMRGTIAMARTADPHSATAQFFINVVDNDRLNFTSENPAGWGYCVFGNVIEGMDVVDKIRYTKTTQKNGRGDVPVKPITITKVKVDGYKVTFGVEFTE